MPIDKLPCNAVKGLVATGSARALGENIKNDCVSFLMLEGAKARSIAVQIICKAMRLCDATGRTKHVSIA